MAGTTGLEPATSALTTLPECNQGYRLRPRPTTTRDETFLPKRNLPYFPLRLIVLAYEGHFE